MEELSKRKMMGLYSLEHKMCGCNIKRYTGGKVIVSGCTRHKNFMAYICPICKSKYQNKQDLKKCRWNHAL